MIIAYQVGYFPKLVLLAAAFLGVANNEALAFWSLLGVLTKPWVYPFFSKDYIFGAEFHLKMLENIIEEKFVELRGFSLECFLSEVCEMDLLPVCDILLVVCVLYNYRKDGSEYINSLLPF